MGPRRAVDNSIVRARVFPIWVNEVNVVDRIDIDQVVQAVKKIGEAFLGL